MEVTLNLLENIYRNFTELAEKKHRRVEDIIANKLRDDFSDETDNYEEKVAGWMDEDVLALAKLTLPKEQAGRMSELSDKVQTGMVSKVEENELKFILKSTIMPIFARHTELPKL